MRQKSRVTCFPVHSPTNHSRLARKEINFYQTQCSRSCSTNTPVIDSVSKWSFSSKSSKHHHSQTVGATNLKYWHNGHHCTCYVSCVTCHVFFVFFQIKWWSLSVEGLLSTGLREGVKKTHWICDHDHTRQGGAGSADGDHTLLGLFSML